MADINPHFLEIALSLSEATKAGANATVLGNQWKMSASQVRHYVRLDKKLSDAVKKLCRKTPEISMGHARVLATLPSQKQLHVARDVIAKRWSVRYLEHFVRAPSPPEDQAYYEKLSESLSEQLGHPLSVRPETNTPQNGVITLRYFGFDDFDSICSKLGVSADAI